MHFAAKLARCGHVDMIRTGGFLELNEALIKGLKLNWGAWYGDIMHFDMRTDGDIGQNIADQVGVYLAKMNKQADAPDPPVAGGGGGGRGGCGPAHSSSNAYSSQSAIRR